MSLPATVTYADKKIWFSPVECSYNDMKGSIMGLGAAEEVATQGMISPYVFGGFAFLVLVALLVVTAMINVDR